MYVTDTAFASSEAGPSNLQAHPQPGLTPGPAYTVDGEPVVSRKEYEALRQELNDLRVVHHNLQERYQELERVVDNVVSRVDSVKRGMTSIAQVCGSTHQSVMGMPSDPLRTDISMPFVWEDASPQPQGPPRSRSPSPSTYPVLTLLLVQEEHEDSFHASLVVGNPTMPLIERSPPPPLVSPPPTAPLLTGTHVAALNW